MSLASELGIDDVNKMSLNCIVLEMNIPMMTIQI